jgi:hypothetical protein
MAICIVICLVLFCPLIFGYTDDSINLLVRPSTPFNSTIRRYCVELATLPNGRTINITNFSWHKPYIGAPSVNACNITDIEHSLPHVFPRRTLLILREHQCKMTEHAWNIERQYGRDISLMILTNRTDTHYELTFNRSAMPVSIPVLIFVENDFNRMQQFYGNNTANIEISIDYPLVMPKKFRPAVLLMFALVFFILLAGNSWAADEFRSKTINIDRRTSENTTQTDRSLSRTEHLQDPFINHVHEPIANITGTTNENLPTTTSSERTPKTGEAAILTIPYCIIGLILFFAVSWLLLIYYFPKVMIYILQGMTNRFSLELTLNRSCLYYRWLISDLTLFVDN